MADDKSVPLDGIKDSLRTLASRVGDTHRVLRGDVVLRLSGEKGGTLRVKPGRGKDDIEITEADDSAAAPLFEVIGDAEAVQAVLDGRVDGESQFLAGGIRIRGDLRSFSDLAQELGFLKHPL